MDWQRGNIPYFEVPPKFDDDGNEIPDIKHLPAVTAAAEAEDDNLEEEAKEENDEDEASADENWSLIYRAS